jgi:tetratricopeptide (TPR) repeat protein
MKATVETIYGTKRWRSYALCNAGMTFESSGKTDAALSMYMAALANDGQNLIARMNLGGLLLERGGIRSAIKQLQVAKDEATVQGTAENHPVYYYATFRLAVAIYQQGSDQLTEAYEEATTLRAEIIKGIKAIRKRWRPARRSIALWVRLRRIGLRSVALRLRQRARRALATAMENDGRFLGYLEELWPSVVAMIAGIEKEMGKNTEPPRLTERNLWRPSPALQYNLACTAAVWLRDAKESLDVTEKKARTEAPSAGNEAAAYERHNALLQRAVGLRAEVTRWHDDVLNHLEFAFRLDRRWAPWAEKDRAFATMKDDSDFKLLIEHATG